MKNLKYLAAYINPLLAIFGLLLGGYYTFLNVVYVFMLVPILDNIIPPTDTTKSREEKQDYLQNKIFDWLLYLNFPILIGVMLLFGYTLETGTWSALELSGNTFSVAIVIVTCGINVGHELGHRSSKMEQWLSKFSYIPALYTHFFIEHNRGHHKHIATDLDPASAEKGELLYTFWFKSMIGGYLSAWKIEHKRLRQAGKSWFHPDNEMLLLSAIQLSYILGVYLWCSFSSFLLLMLAGFIGAILLETINYIEHYGLRRSKLASGRYERVGPQHSWNSNLQFGRIVLYELTLHSDHHFISSKKYQVLDHYEEAPQMPYGYPTMVIISLFPPLWFKIMHQQLARL